MAIEEKDLSLTPEQPRYPVLSERRAAAIVLHMLQPADATPYELAATRADIAAVGGSDPDALQLAHKWFNQITATQ